MQLEGVYHDLFRQALSDQIPAWDALSPFDPAKVFAEGLALATTAIERRHARLVETLLDTLPALFGFEAKPALPPSGLFQFQPSPSLACTRQIPAGSVFRIAGPGNVQIAVGKTASVSPLKITSIIKQGPLVLIQLETNTAISEIQLTYIPEAAANARNMSDLALTLEAAETQPVRFRESFEIEDSTVNFSQLGSLRLRPAVGSAAKFCSQASRLTLRLELEGKAELPGQFLVNAFRGTFGRWTENIKLGVLRGEPWEELFLNANVIEPPDSILLHFPDDRTLVLKRIDCELLKVRVTDSEEFKFCFFYNAINHSLILPCASQLLGQYQGGISVFAPRLHCAPEWQDFSSVAKASPGEWSAVLESVSQIRFLTAHRPREDKVSYLKRFYTSLRLVANQPQQPSYPDEIVQAVMGCHPSIEQVEALANPKDKTLQVFVLPILELPENRALSAEVRETVSEVLSRYVPLDYAWSVHPFSACHLSMQVNADIQLSGERTQTFSEENLRTECRSLLTDLCQPAAWPPDQSHSMQQLAAKLARRLTRPSQSVLLAQELKSLSIITQDQTSGQYLTVLNRLPGQQFITTVECKSQTIRSWEKVD